MTKPVRGALGATVVAALALAVPVSALAQVSRVTGTVRDENGDPVRGATVVAENQLASPARSTAVTDAKGRFGMLGLRSGTWTFEASAPGFLPARGSTRVRGIGNNPPIDFRIVRESVAAPGVLGRADLDALQAKLSVAHELLAAGRYADAIASYETILTQVPALTAVNLQIGRAYRAAGQLPEALAAFERAARAEPPVEHAVVEAGLTELALGRLDAAEARIAPLARRDEVVPEVHYGLGEVKRARGDRQAAIECYEKAAAADPTWATPRLRLGAAAAEGGDTVTAVRYLEQVVALDPRSAEADEARTLLAGLRRH
jgi:Flp pilus assembly protein TadD